MESELEQIVQDLKTVEEQKDALARAEKLKTNNKKASSIRKMWQALVKSGTPENLARQWGLLASCLVYSFF